MQNSSAIVIGGPFTPRRRLRPRLAGPMTICVPGGGRAVMALTVAMMVMAVAVMVAVMVAAVADVMAAVVVVMVAVAVGWQ